MWFPRDIWFDVWFHHNSTEQNTKSKLRSYLVIAKYGTSESAEYSVTIRDKVCEPSYEFNKVIKTKSRDS